MASRHRAPSSLVTTKLIVGITGLVMFKYGPEYEYGTTGIRDLYRLEAENFSSPAWVAFYVLAMIVVGFHLWHGIASSFQSLGLSGPRFTPAVRKLGKAFAVLIAGG